MNRWHRQQRAGWSLLLAAVLHLLCVWLVSVLLPRDIGPQLFRAARLPLRRFPIARFKPRPAIPVPRALLDRLRAEAAPAAVDIGPAAVEIPALPEVGMPETGDVGLPLGERGGERYAREDTLPSLEQLQLDMVRRRAEELEEYARIWVPDVDTLDAASRGRRLARQIVLAAVNAMGGMDALLEIRDMRYQGRYHKSYGTWSKYAQYLPGQAKVVFDGHRGWVDLFGALHPLTGVSLRQVQRRAARWDFLSRYLGDGVQLTYVGSRGAVRGGAIQHVVKVVDLQFGGEPFWAYFDRDTGLLATEEYRGWLEPNLHVKYGPYLHVNYLDYAPVRRARLWQTVENHDLRAKANARRSSPVSYEVIPDDVFALSNPDSGWVRPGPPELEATLWVEVRFKMRPLASAVLPGGSGRVQPRHRAGLREQVEALALARLGRPGTFRQVVAGIGLREREDLPEGDFVLLIDVFGVDYDEPIRCMRILSPPVYQAQLYEAATMRPIMQDGPPGTGYLVRAEPVTNPFSPCFPRDLLVLRRDCTGYTFSAYTIDEELAYVSPGRLSALLDVTWQKVDATAKAYRAGLREHFPYMRECCYCAEP